MLAVGFEKIQSFGQRLARQFAEACSRDERRTFLDVLFAIAAANGISTRKLLQIEALLEEYARKSKLDLDRNGLRELEELHAKIDAHDGWHLDQRVETTITDLKLPADKKMSELSGGWRRRAALAGQEEPDRERPEVGLGEERGDAARAAHGHTSNRASRSRMRCDARSTRRPIFEWARCIITVRNRGHFRRR